MEKKIRSFRLDDETMMKLDAIRTYHQQYIDSVCLASKVDSIPLSRAQIVKRLIEVEYTSMKDKKMLP